MEEEKGMKREKCPRDEDGYYLTFLFFSNELRLKKREKDIGDEEIKTDERDNKKNVADRE